LLRIGRDAQQCQLAIPNVPGVSRTHCVVRTDGKRIEVRDLHSSYGTFLSDGTRIDPDRPVFVQNGAQLYLGSRQPVVSVKLV
jgi:pSer/pThr/pTyr-binding forkhead associated (FHA) protein